MIEREPVHRALFHRELTMACKLVKATHEGKPTLTKVPRPRGFVTHIYRILFSKQPAALFLHAPYPSGLCPPQITLGMV